VSVGGGSAGAVTDMSACVCPAGQYNSPCASVTGNCYGCVEAAPTAAPTVSPADAAAAKDGLSSGALAGIIIGSILGVAALAGFYFYCIKGSDAGSDAKREMVPLKV